ncbi:MAG: DedA family protein [Candidatus Vogelbacteria bacterium]|nr:DedA family protein [Candidatus Vogelbacteria bacterium]
MFFTYGEVIALLIQYKYIILFPLSIIEGPVVTMIAGMLSSPAFGYFNLNIWFVYVIVVVGDLIGDAINYGMGHFGRHSFIHKWGHHFGLTDDRVQAVENHFEKHPGKTLLIGKLTHAAGTIVLFAAGMANVPFWQFIWYNFIGTLPKSLVLLLIGYFFGHAFSQINDSLNYASMFLLFALVLLSGMFYWYRQKSNKDLERL